MTPRGRTISTASTSRRSRSRKPARNSTAKRRYSRPSRIRRTGRRAHRPAIRESVKVSVDSASVEGLTPMKITAFKVRLFEYPMPKPFHPTWQPVPTTAARIHVVEIHTDEGITGIGSGGVPVRWEVAGLFLMGQDPFALEQHVANLRSMAFFVGRPWPVEIALRDIIGKATGQPVYKLLGGGSGRLKAYASAGELRPTEARVESAQQIVSEGFRALTLRFHSADWRDDLKTLEAVRKAVGDAIDIMVDANWGWRIAPDRQPNRWDLKTAIAAARAMEEYNVYWLEEPLDAYDYDGLAELRSHMTTLRL